MTQFGYLPGEDFDAFRARQRKQEETGAALALARAERDAWLTADEVAAIAHNVRWGSDSYPVAKLGKKWQLSHPAAKGTPLYKRKLDAWAAWEVLLASWRHLQGLQRLAGVSEA
jgi:hypothetical protein